MTIPTIIGAVAGALTSLAALPQVIKLIKSKSTHDISLLYFIVLNTGIILWIMYGIMLGLWTLIIANVVTLLLTGTILIYKLIYK